MIGLHEFSNNFFSSMYLYLLFNNVFIFIMSTYFIIILFLSIIFYSKFNTVFFNQIKNTLKQIYFFSLLISIFFFFFKLFYSSWFITGDYLTASISFNTKISKQIFFNFNPFGDVLVLLCLLTILISWIYLSERYLFFNIFNVFYFFIFIIFTINMVYSKNLLIMFIFFEFIFLPSLYFVYWLSYSKKSNKTVKYLLLWTLTGSFMVACGLAYLYGITKTFNLENLYFFQFSILENYLFFFCFFIGFGVKLPLWPFHYWLTKVHVEAPTGFSIFLSGFLVKTALYCLIYFILLFKNFYAIYFAFGIIFFGALDASIRMWSATDIKRLIAFATIQEMNLIVGLLLLLNNSYFQILNIFILVHGILSTLLFFLVDQIQKRFYTRNLIVISGLATKAPLLHIIIWLTILVFRGFPLFIKFFIEWELLSILLNNFFIWGFIIFFLVSMYGVLGFCRIWFMVLYGQPNPNIKNSGDILKKDLIVASYLLLFLFSLSLVIFFFNGCSF